MKTIPIPVKFDRQGHSCNFYAGFGPTNHCFRITLLHALSHVPAMPTHTAHPLTRPLTQTDFTSAPTGTPSRSTRVPSLLNPTTHHILRARGFLQPIHFLGLFRRPSSPGSDRISKVKEASAGPPGIPTVIQHGSYNNSFSLLSTLPACTLFIPSRPFGYDQV